MFKQFARQLPEGWDRFSCFFAALGDSTRLKMLTLFEAHEEICVNEIAAVFDISRPAVSHHLKVLRNAAILVCEKRGKEVYYRVNYEYCSRVLTLTHDIAEKGVRGMRAVNVTT